MGLCIYTYIYIHIYVIFPYSYIVFPMYQIQGYLPPYVPCITLITNLGRRYHFSLPIKDEKIKA